ncbi:hypothetical protein [Bacillus sp. MRMR6]|uniref:hypothetical protein n=1 Tax=Bacillus sp. MRMR6 TaxID=1928617 RepID=UPI0026B4BBF6|nr:hypothetical protein [Bacillus sp. MRMR6]
MVENIIISRQEISAGESLKVTAKISDNLSGVASATLMLCDENCYQAPFYHNSGTGLWEATFTFYPGVMDEGTYKVDIQVYDYAGNLTYPKIDQVVKLKRLTGWVWRDGKWWFYFDPNTGELKTGWYKVGTVWYYSNLTGVMQTGWMKDGATWYYLNSSGAMQTGWLKQGTTWYYLKPSGSMATGWQKVGTSWYYFASSGAMYTGWLKSGVNWYYLKSSGAMATGWETIAGKRYYFDGNGVWR